VDINGGEYRFRTRALINCAGLHSDKVAELAGMDIDELSYPGLINLIGIESPRLTYCLAIGKHVSSLVEKALQ
jgi:hypothetical protein